MQPGICGLSRAEKGRPCPKCGQRGLPVKQVTVAGLVKEEKLDLVAGEGFHLCVSPECKVAYFKEAVVIQEEELRVPLWFKNHVAPVPVCYCANVTDQEILQHIMQGCCSSLEDIQRHTGAGTGKQCLTKNPTGG